MTCWRISWQTTPGQQSLPRHADCADEATAQQVAEALRTAHTGLYVVLWTPGEERAS